MNLSVIVSEIVGYRTILIVLPTQIVFPTLQLFMMMAKRITERKKWKNELQMPTKGSVLLRSCLTFSKMARKTYSMWRLRETLAEAAFYWTIIYKFLFA